MPTAVADRAAEVAEVAGASVAAHFGDPEQEYEAARHGVGLAHRGRRALVRISGPDHRTFLQGLLTNDVAGLAPGEGRPALFLDTKGHVRGALDLWAEVDAIVVGCDTRFVGSVLPDLAKYVLGADVSIDDRRGLDTVLAVHGAGGEESLARAGISVPDGSPRAHCMGEIAGVAVRLARTPDLASPGVEVHAVAEAVDDVWNALEEAAHDFAPVYIGWDVAEVLRVEAGVAAFDREISGEEFPQEALLDEAIDYEKGCYLGQETVARIHYRGQVNRLLSGLRADSPLPDGAELILSGQEVGRVTSAVVSPRLGPIGLGYVRREQSEAGDVLDVRVGGAEVGTARVVSLPFDDREGAAGKESTCR